MKFRDILLTGTGHRDRRLNRDSPGQTGTYGRSNLTKSNFRFIHERPFAIPSFHQKCRIPEKFRPGALPPQTPLVGALARTDQADWITPCAWVCVLHISQQLRYVQNHQIKFHRQLWLHFCSEHVIIGFSAFAYMQTVSRFLAPWNIAPRPTK